MNSYQDLTKEQLIEKVNELSVLIKGMQEEKNQQFEALSRIDFLTKLINRPVLYERLVYETKRATRTKESLSIVILNIDHLKKVNDQFGQVMGDQVLVEVAKIVTSTVRSTDIVGRYGGDQILIILPACDAVNASTVAEQIRESVELNIFNDELRITVSGGIHQYHGESVDQCIDSVERLLAQAKQNGRNRIEIAANPVITN